MTNKLLSLFFSITIALAWLPAKAQYALKEADEQYELYNFIKAIDLYERSYLKNKSLHAAERLANCYELTRNYKETESWAAIAAGMAGSKPENTLMYAKALQNNSKFNEAKIQYAKYAAQKQVSAAQKSAWLLACDSAIHWMKNPGKTTVQNLGTLNSPQADWGAVRNGETLVFASDRASSGETAQKTDKPFLKFDGSKKPDPQVYGWTGNHYLRLYSQDKIQNTSAHFPLQTGTQYHVGAATFNAAGDEMYFTLTRIPEKPKYTNGKLATINVEIYSSQKSGNGDWSAPAPFAYNNVNEYSVGDPYLSKDGKVLYFAASFPGGKGGTDLYYCMRTAQGNWGKPINLEEFNTEGNERFPFFDGESTFYFSTDGLIGMGGLDIFKSVRSNGKMTRPVNMGYPINSPQDDFAFNLSSELEGYFSSNRIEGMGNDDIYSFKAQEPTTFTLTGRAYHKQTGEPLSDVIVTLVKKDGGQLKVQAETDGSYKFNLEKEADYYLIGEKTGFHSHTVNMNTRNLSVSTALKQDLLLDPIVVGKAIKLENIYYSFDKADIRPESAIELNKIVKLMQDNPTIWIELGSHTDSRGDDNYNLQLSQRRANAVVRYIVDSGISANRIKAKGYGESQLFNGCTNGVTCTIAEHQANRRTEFKVVKY